ncbi:MAG: hypothetical protein K2H98_00635, partial [Duncaniella sp.]|nr:hypothetical protein [Duncaniella sp.]
IDNPDAASYRDPLNGYQTGVWNDDNSAVFEFESDDTVPVVANDGYEILGATCNGVTVASGPETSITILTSNLEDGDVVNVTTDTKKPKQIKIVGDPARIYVQDEDGVKHDASDNVDGAWLITCKSDWNTTYVLANDGYLLTSAKDENGRVYLSSTNNYFSIYHGDLKSGVNTVTVEAKSEDEIYDGNITVNLDGSPYYVSFCFNGQYNGVNLKQGENTVRFSRDTDLPFIIKHGYDNEYNPMSLYKVSLNGTPLEAVNRQYTITEINNGDVIDISVDPPAVDVNVHVLFDDNEASKKALLQVRNDGKLVNSTDYESFVSQTGKSISFNFDYKNYNVTLTENGNPVYVSYGSATRNLNVEQDYTYMISATEIEPYKVTIICENYENLIVASDAYGENAYELTGIESEISVLPSNTTTHFIPKDGWKIKRLSNADTDTELYNPCTVTDGLSVFVELEEFKRDKECTVYVDPIGWNYLMFVLAPNSNTDCKYFYLKSDYDETGELDPGYQTMYYNDSDRPFGISGSDKSYMSPVVYLNGEVCEGNYGSYPALANVQEGDVIKIMGSDTPVHEVSYKVSPDVNVKVVHDRTMEVDHTATHQAHSGTEIHIIPVSRAGIKVTAGGNEIVPDEEGKFVHIVSEPVEIAIAPAVPTSIIDIEASANEVVDVYNLQGVCVRKAAAPAEINNLPAGIYVTAAGKKIVVK